MPRGFRFAAITKLAWLDCKAGQHNSTLSTKPTRRDNPPGAPNSHIANIARTVHQQIRYTILLYRLAPFLLFFFAFSYAHAGADFCVPLVSAPTVTLQLSPPQRQYRHDQGVEVLTVLANRAGSPGPDKGAVAGLTSVQQRFQVKAWLDYSQFKDGYCVSPHAQITIIDRRITVSIAKEMVSNSCEYQITVDHEHKHVRVAEVDMDRLVREAVARMNRDIQNEYGFYQDLQHAQAWLDRLPTALEKRVQTTLDKINKINMAIDTPEEYARLDRDCPKALSQKRWWQVW